MFEKDVAVRHSDGDCFFKQARRIVVLGIPGSGKSVFSSQLARMTDLPLVRIDDLNWNSDWVRREKTEFLRALQDEVSKNEWIIDGNYHDRYFHERLERADLIVLLDCSTFVALWGVISRAVKRRLGDKSSLPKRVSEGNQYSPTFGLKPRFLWFVLTFNWHVRPFLYRYLTGMAYRKTVIIRSRKEARRVFATS